MKGLSPLIAAILLIVIVISVATIFTSWVNNFVYQTQDDFANKTAESRDCTLAHIDIKRVFLTNGTNATGSIVVENIGSIDGLTITSAQVYNKTGANFSGNGIPITGFDKGEIVTITFENAKIPTCDAYDTVIVSTSCSGVEDRYRSVPEGC